MPRASRTPDSWGRRALRFMIPRLYPAGRTRIVGLQPRPIPGYLVPAPVQLMARPIINSCAERVSGLASNARGAAEGRTSEHLRNGQFSGPRADSREGNQPDSRRWSEVHDRMVGIFGHCHGSLFRWTVGDYPSNCHLGSCHLDCTPRILGPLAAGSSGNELVRFNPNRSNRV
jgi:hypothetical protein